MNQSSSEHASVLDTISERIKHLPLKLKLAWGYSIVFASFFAAGFIAIFLMFEGFRQQEFYQRVKDRLQTTHRLLIVVKEIDGNLLKLFDQNTINNLYDEDIILFDSTGKVIYHNKATQPVYSKHILDQLIREQKEIRVVDQKHELLALKFNAQGQTTYGIARAYDLYGRSKADFLKYLLIATYIVVSVLLVIGSVILAGYITRPIVQLTQSIESISPADFSIRVTKAKTNDEIGLLTNKFNELLEKLESSYKFQRHFIQHISHELKTPLSIMLIKIEAALESNNAEQIKHDLMFQKKGLMDLSYTINAMLDISKTENQITDVKSDDIRMDDLLFDCIDEVCTVTPGRVIDIKFDEAIDEEAMLMLNGNRNMLKMAFMNLMQNAIYYSDVTNPSVSIAQTGDRLTVQIINDGATISDAEKLKMFMHLFRGTNSLGKKGFGLGLVLVERIVMLHKGEITYSITTEGKNCFTVWLPFKS